MGLLLLAETISGDTSVSVTLIVSLVMLIGGIASTSLVSRVTHGLAIKQLREKDRDVTERLAAAEAKLGELELWRARREGRDDAIEKHTSASSVRGTQPYRSGR